MMPLVPPVPAVVFPGGRFRLFTQEIVAFGVLKSIGCKRKGGCKKAGKI